MFRYTTTLHAADRRDESRQTPVLVFSSAARRCALPVSDVEETMRPAPCMPIAGAPPFLLGVARVRGVATPIVDLGAFLGAPDGERARRFIILRVGPRRIGIAVSDVRGVYHLSEASLGAVPPLLSIAPMEHVDAIAAADDGLFTVIRPARLLPDDLWSSIDGKDETP